MKRGLIIPITASLFALASYASAQEAPRPSFLGRPVEAPRNALELGVGAQYSQGMGRLSARHGDTVRSIAGAGATGEVNVGWRFTPHFSMGVYGTGSQFDANDRLPSGTNVRGMTAGIQANYHFNPFRAMDPWVGIGGGWRGLWVVPERGAVTARQGLDIARLQIGADYRIAPELAIGPVIGADVSMFLSEKFPQETMAPINGPRLNLFVSAGLAGRFDLLGQKEPKPVTNVASR